LALGFKGDVSVGDGFENALAADLQPIKPLILG